ncbi:similar to transcription factor jumonji (jmjC) domain-containing protein [Plenodomus lingam JN3]|uniref:Similar to transcription factor jumonji (JmjC) domain-containing protein n=1 Tax=Leptosphaeria maculans (strain JN3 / isolate v23.1.3 / race Av1-4-5-6-7-8) TaxID=985895 RepID=E5AA20_LEPMJ|nr:similar to transcription factor jumonji (jmjC) domain-containing protein [Plenodomus lingam JN3]CBY00511.1 similar to transcription factor jumonji (jmjC) domain-containing protein [Plenodomus lingam JN3]
MDGDAPTLQEITQLTRQELTAKRDDDAIRECGRAALALLTTDPELATRLAYQKLHDVPYKDVRTCWRRLYTDANLWTVLRLVEGRNEEAAKEAQQQLESSEGTEEDWINETIKALDMALILTGAPAREDLVELWFSSLQRHLYPHEPSRQSHSPSETAPLRPCKRRKLSVPSLSNMPSKFVTILPTPAPTLEYPIPRTHAPSFEAFQRKLDDPNSHTPLIIEGAIQHWPALDERPWNNPSYLMRQTLGGRRLVPVEIGRSYTDEAWGQRILTFREFMETYMLNRLRVHDAPGEEPTTTTTKTNKTQPSKEQPQTGYLAQHDLFTQIPSLRPDICIPEYCYCTPSPTPKPPTSPHSSSPSSPSSPSPTPTQPLLNAWFGPAHTISPLHTDPHHNILAQVVGYKYVRLYAPCETSRLYPRGREAGGVDMGNTSAVDLEEVGVGVGPGGEGEELGAEERKRAFEERFPRFREARYVEGVLGPGECLYLPVGWWHYVRSLTPSFSVSFWF